MEIPIKITVVYLFSIGVFLGLILGLAFPFLSDSYANFYLADVQNYALGLRAEFGAIGILFAIFSRNFILAAILILGAYIIAYSCIRQGKDTHKLLTLFTICTILAYGFFPYGLFIAYLYVNLQPNLFIKWISYFIPHGPLEIMIILSAGSTGISLRNSFSRKGNLWSWKNNNIAKKLLIAGFSLLAAAFIEAYVSPYFLAN